MGYNFFDINSDFYQDICVPYTSPNGTDVLLDDRINYYYYNDELWQKSKYYVNLIVNFLILNS